MNNLLVLMLSVMGLLAIYWVLIGQGKLNKKFREAEENAKKQEDRVNNI